MTKIYFTVTNDLSYDQRMIRICTTLSLEGYDVVLVGRKLKNSIELKQLPFKQVRLKCFINQGFGFYFIYNIRLFLFLIFKKMDGICSIDLDTIIPGLFVTKLRGKKRIYDAHELFCEMKEISERPFIYKVWKFIEKITVPFFKNGYTVNEPIALEFKKLYGLNYEVIRSIANYDKNIQDRKREKFLIYQGAVNEGRSFETLIPAMKFIDSQLHIFGDGNFMERAVKLCNDLNLNNKITFHGMVSPDKLKSFTSTAYIGFTIFESEAKSNYYSLANRFFDYINAATPQVCVDYPAYKKLNDEFKVAVLTNDISSESLSKIINDLLSDDEKWNNLHLNCIAASKVLNWQNESVKLISFYKKIFG